MAALCISLARSETLFPVPQKKKSGWSLGGFKPTVFSTLKEPHPTLMFSFSSTLNNWMADKGLLGTQGVYRHWVHDSCIELLPLACPVEIRKVWFQGILKALI